MLKALWTDTNSAYLATTSGLSIIDLAEEGLYAYTTKSGGFTAVWGNDSTIYLGASSGIYYLEKACITGTVAAPLDIAFCLLEYSPSPAVKYIHGNNNLISVITEAGISITKLGDQGYTSSATISGTTKCFVTPDKLYYITSGTSWAVNRLDTLVCDWTEPTYKYITGSGIIPAGVTINDIFVTHNTSLDGKSNTLFIATSSGVIVLDEGTRYYSTFYRSK